MAFDRRQTLKMFAGAGTWLMANPFTASLARAQGSRASSSLDPYRDMHWGSGIEGQRRADLGDGTFLNPVFAGDHPDPSLLRDGDDYYVTFSSFDAYPGIVIWHSPDLVNWTPVTAALRTPVGSVWAPELAKHGDRYFCYIPARFADYRSIYVIHADDIAGPWSEPIDLKLHQHIDPGHIVDAEGGRWLFLSGGDRVPLAPDGLAVAGPVEHVYDPWRYPDDWIVETFAPEGPKIVRRGEYFYMVTAVGGTAGPPTGHMVIMARSRSINGPWENDPQNPVIKTWSAEEKWWSRGHATLFEGPGEKWWMIYHGYENGYWTLGRQTLLEPVSWTDDGWIKPLGDDLSSPLQKPVNLGPQAHGQALSDDFSTVRYGTQWAFYDPAPNESSRLRRADGRLQVRGKGTTPGDSSPLCCIVGDQAYQVEVDVTTDASTEAGLVLFYNRRLYAGLGIGPHGMVMHRYGLQRLLGTAPGQRDDPVAKSNKQSVRIRLHNDRNILTIYTSHDAGSSWQKFAVQMEVSGYHHNVAYDFLSLRPALYVAGEGTASFANFVYKGLM